jgi:F-type H+-transporting ATPase subunit delta
MLGASRKSMAAARERLDALAAVSTTDMARTAAELGSVATVLDGNVSLRRLLTDPARDGDAKAQLITSMLQGKVSGEVTDFVAGLARSRWSQPRDLADAVDELAVDAELIIAQREDKLDDLEDELFRFGRILTAERELRSTLTDPSVSGTRKSELVSGVLAGKTLPVTGRLVTRVVTNPRGRSLEASLESFQKLAAARRQRMVALVTVAVPLTEVQRDRLTAALGKLYGHAVHLNVEIDPEVVGGVRVQIGDDIIDGSTATKLDAASRRFAA